MQNKKASMGYERFKIDIVNEVRKRTGLNVQLQKITKNNGLVLDGLTILAEGMNISPTIYISNYFDTYLNSGLHVAADRIIEAYEGNKPCVPIDTKFFTDFENVKSRIKVKIVNYEKNRELLEKVPHITYLDLAMIFYVEVVNKPDIGEKATIQIYNHHMSFWDADVNDLYHLAIENSKNDYQIKSMMNVVQDIMEDDFIGEFMASQEVGMYILTNQSQLHGASGILQFDILNRFMEEHNTERIAILPSSIHETLLIPNISVDDFVRFKEIVKEVNATTLQPDEFLSNSVYVYDGDRITIWN